MIVTRYFDSDTDLQSEIARLLINRNLVPIFGSGFTRGCKAHSGTVPSGDDMKNFLVKTVAEAFGESEEEYSSMTFSALCTLFDKKTTPAVKYSYFVDNFTDVKLEALKIRFLSLDWSYIYTLNIDDAIERNCNKYHVILPHRDFSEQYLASFYTLFKIHGDVHSYLKYPSENIVFNKRQYIDSLRTNKKMLAKFKEDFCDNNLLFVGCSLSDEPDLMSVIVDELRANSSIRNTYFVSHKELTKAEEILLEDYGITTCVVVADYNVFYQTIITLAENRSSMRTAFVDFYREPSIITVSQAQSDLRFLLNSNNLVPQPFDKTLHKPYFFISRSVSLDVLDKLTMNCPIHIIYGNRISGKTYCLFDMYDKVKNQDRYFFPSGSGFTAKMMDELLQKRDSFFAFDTDCLTAEQIYRIIDKSTELGAQGNRVVITINTSDRYGVDLLVEHKRYKVTKIPNRFTDDEMAGVNRILQNSNMPTFAFREKRTNALGRQHFVSRTLLDNLYEISLRFAKSHTAYVMPDLSKITDREQLATLLILATKHSISSNDMFYFNINSECAEFASLYPSMFQFTYCDSTPTRADSKRQLIVNARYHLLKSLGKLVDDDALHQKISNAYRYIYDCIETNEDPFVVSRRMLDYIKFDVINDIFYAKKPLVSLIKFLYEQLEPQMNVNPQFKHQRAKSILWLGSDSLDEIREARRYVELAIYDTENDLSRSGNKKLRISLEHTKYTFAIIMGRICSLNAYSDMSDMIAALDAYEDALFCEANQDELIALQSRTTERRIIEDLVGLFEQFKDTSIKIEDFQRQRAANIAQRLNCM
ncbi:MAG: SIR2 family protein [Oscillospiraceae bacterium]|nr:SIR2 family protein [Oscillospiraceae bacterium]